MATLQDTLIAVASYINQDPTLPTGTDLTMWINLINQSQNEWANTYLWKKQLGQTYKPSISYSQSSIGLPVNFQRLLSPVFDMSQSTGVRYFEITPDERYLKVSTDKYVFMGGNDVSGRYLVINPPLSSGASISFDYLSSPSSLVTYQDTITCPSTQYVVLKTISKILSARSDPRFTIVDQQAETMMDQMMNDEAARSGGIDNQGVSTIAKKGFRIGEQ